MNRAELERVVAVERMYERTTPRYIPRPQRWTRRQIITHIRAWVKEHGEPPGHDEWNAPRGRGFPSSASLARHFGTFNAAVIAAGFEPRGPGECHAADPGGKRVRPQKRTARLTSADLAAAYVLYDRRRLSMVDLGRLLWQKFGYPSAASCQAALNKGFVAEGFRIRTKSESRMCLSDEKRKEIARRMREGRAYKKLSAAERNEIIRLRGTERQVDIAARVGVSQSTVGRIQRAANNNDRPRGTSHPGAPRGQMEES